MMPEEWPIAAEAADRLVDPARVRGPSRLATVRRDFLLDPSDRLSEQERALMTAMFHDFVASLAIAIRAAAGGRPPERAPADIAEELSGAELADRAGLLALMLRRADEHRIAAAFAGRSRAPKLAFVSRLVSDDDPAVAAAAMAVVVARGRRLDGFGQPRIELTDLQADDQSSLAHAVAAILSPGREDDGRYAEAAGRVIDAAKEEDSLDDTLTDLVEELVRAGRDDKELLERASGEGEIALIAAILARRSGIGGQASWDHMLNAGEGGLALLARMSDLPRPVAARLIADLGSHLGTTSVEEEIAAFDGLAAGEVLAAKDHWRLPRDYRVARVALRGDRG